MQLVMQLVTHDIQHVTHDTPGGKDSGSGKGQLYKEKCTFLLNFFLKWRGGPKPIC